MSEKEKKILESITKAVPNMSEFDKGYSLGSAKQLQNTRIPIKLTSFLSRRFQKVIRQIKTIYKVLNLEVKAN